MKKVKCQICRLKKGKVENYIGGFVSYAHEDCLKKGFKAINLYNDWFIMRARGIRDEKSL